MNQNKTTEFIKWAENVKREWRHIPTFKGKKAIYKLFIIRALALKGKASCWELALDYLKETIYNFNELTADTIYHRRHAVNSALYRAIIELQKKHYVEKLNAEFRLTLKGSIFAFALDPSFIKAVLPSITDTTIRQIIKDNTDIFPTQIYPSDEALRKMREAFDNEISLEMFRNGLKKLLTVWKINIDEISEDELKSLLAEALQKIFLEFKKGRKSLLKALKLNY